MILPKSIATEIDLEDVELSELLAKAALLGIRLPVEVAGRVSIKAQATIPLGTLRDLRAYAFHGLATLSAASIAGVDVGRLSSRIDLEDGILELTDFHGQLVDLPDGGSDNRAGPTAPIAARGPLPPGGFRGRLRAELSPPGRMEARFEAEGLPLGELAAPALPRPTPLSGLVSLDVDASADLASLSDPKAWRVAASLRGARITHRARTLESVSARLTLEGGWLAIPTLSARLGDRPLTASLEADLTAPHDFSGRIDVAEWGVGDLLALIPGVPHPEVFDGRLSVGAEARGTLAPWSVETKGQGALARARAGPIALGDVPFRWASEPGAIAISGIEARPLGGRLTAWARVPTGPGGAARGTVTLVGIDAAQVAEVVPDRALQLRGAADLFASFVVPTVAVADASAWTADVRLSAPGLEVQGMPTRGVGGSLSVRAGVLTYELAAKGLGGLLRCGGSLPVPAAVAAVAPSRTRLQAG
ncbi:MAG TPA: hypothetical protein VF590_26775, partial [Isosphaeraceae bacterium]